jgi:prophage antirepressor-like protein
MAEASEENSLLIKRFQEHNISFYGTWEDPLFKAKEACFARPASDIGELLEMSNINMTISDFDQDEKVVHNMHTIRGMQEVNMLTEQGLYKILFISRKPLAKEFQKWVYSIIKEVRLNGSYTMKKQLREQSLNKNLLVLSKTS